MGNRKKIRTKMKADRKVTAAKIRKAKAVRFVKAAAKEVQK